MKNALFLVLLLFPLSPVTATDPCLTTLSVSPSSVAPGDSVSETWTDVPTPTATDWIGIYTATGTDGQYLGWRYTTGTASGTVSYPISSTLAPGLYEFRLFANDGFTKLATSTLVTVTGNTLSFSPSSIIRGENGTATWRGLTSPTANDWIGLYPPTATDSQYLSWRYTTGTASGTVPFPIASSVTAGTYELRVFANDGYTRLATSPTFTVTQ